MSGSLSREEADTTLSVLIIAEDLIPFATFLMPEPIRIGNLEFPIGRSLFNFPQLTVQGISYSSFDEGFPVDPFGADTGAPSNTYFPVLKVDIKYKTDRNADQDPFTFLEITGNATGNFLHTAVAGAETQDFKNDNPPDSETQEQTAEDEEDGGKETVRDPNIAATIREPMT